MNLAKKYGIAFKVGNASYSPIDASFKLEMALVGDVNGKTPEEIQKEKAKAEFATHAPMFGLEADDFGAVISIHGEEFEIVGIKPNSPKNRYLGKKIGTNTVYKLPASLVESQLKAA